MSKSTLALTPKCSLVSGGGGGGGVTYVILMLHNDVTFMYHSLAYILKYQEIKVAKSPGWREWSTAIPRSSSFQFTFKLQVRKYNQFILQRN